MSSRVNNYAPRCPTTHSQDRWLFAAGAILWFVDQRSTSQAEGHAAGRAHFIADVLLRDRLTETDFAKPSVGNRRAELDSLFHRAGQRASSASTWSHPAA